MNITGSEVRMKKLFQRVKNSADRNPLRNDEAAEKHTVFQVYFYNTQKIHQFRLFWWIFCYPDKISDYFRCYLCLFFVYQFNDPFEVYCKYSHRSLHLHVNEA